MVFERPHAHVYSLSIKTAHMFFEIKSTVYNMSGRVVSADTNSSRNGLKTSSSYKPTGEKSLEIDEVYTEKIKVKVYVNQQNCVSQYTDID